MTTTAMSTAATHEQKTEPIVPSSKVRTPRKPLERATARWVIGFPLVVALIHFLVVQIAATVAYRYGQPTGSSEPANHPPLPLPGFAADLVEPLRLWDGLWYRLVAVEGYGNWSAKAAFWPALPETMGWIADVTGIDPVYVGYLIANISFVFALILIYRLVQLEFDDKVAHRTLWALAFFPTAFFFNAVYTESLFLLTSVGALLLARNGKWWPAGLVSIIAALTRSYGVFLVLPFAILWYKQYGLYIRSLIPKGITVVMPVLGPLIFGLYLEQQPKQHFKAFIDVQSEWNRTFAWPWQTMRCATDGCVLSLTQYGTTKDWPVKGTDWSWFSQLRADPSWALVSSEAWRKGIANSHTLELVVTVIFLMIALVGLKLLPLYMSAWLIPALVVPLFSPSTVNPLMSMPRFVLTMFPAFIVIALIVRKRWLGIPLLLISTALLVFYTAQFSNWYWVS